MTTRRTSLKTLAVAGASLVPAARLLAQAGKPKIKIGQIGVGHAHAAGKMKVYRSSEDYEVVGVFEPDDQRWESASQSDTYQGLKRLSQDDLLSTPGLQAVAVETEVKDLLGYAETCVDAGFHIHLDKPAGESLPTFKRILDKADARGLTVQMGYMYRYNPAVVLMRDLLQKGWLGEPFEVHTVMSKVIDASGRKGLDDYPGGIMFELGCHIIDLVVGVLGAPDKVTPYPRRTLDSADDTLVDNMLAVFEYPRATASVKSAALEVEGFSRRHFLVAGTEGTCHIQPLDRPAMRLALSQTRGSYKKGYQDIAFEPPYHRYEGDAADLAAIIRGEKESDYPSSHDYAVQKAVLEASAVPIT